MTLEEAWRASGLSLNALAARTGWDRDTVRRAIRGDRGIGHQPMIDTWQALGYRLAPEPIGDTLPLTLDGLRCVVGNGGRQRQTYATKRNGVP